jgi:predicted ATP-dependent serine protease
MIIYEPNKVAGWRCRCGAWIPKKLDQCRACLTWKDSERRDYTPAKKLAEQVVQRSRKEAGAWYEQLIRTDYFDNSSTAS